MSITLTIATPGPIADFDDLVAAVADYLNRSEITARIPTFIQLAEARFNRLIRTPEMENSAAFAVTGDLLLPDDLLELRAVRIAAGPDREGLLEQVTPAQLRRYGRTAARPCFYALQAGTMRFAPPPDGRYDVTIDYYARLPALSAELQTNWLLDRHPDLYLFSALAHSETYIGTDERVALWKAGADEILAELFGAANRQRYGAAPLRLRAAVTV